VTLKREEQGDDDEGDRNDEAGQAGRGDLSPSTAPGTEMAGVITPSP
jgi:hypothetical protein